MNGSNPNKVLPSMLLDALGGSSKGTNIKERKVRRSRSSSGEHKAVVNSVYHEDAPPESSYYDDIDIADQSMYNTLAAAISGSNQVNDKTVTFVNVPRTLHSRIRQELFNVGDVENYHSPADSNYITVTFSDPNCAKQVLGWDGKMVDNTTVINVKLGGIEGGSMAGSGRSSPDKFTENQSSILNSRANSSPYRHNNSGWNTPIRESARLGSESMNNREIISDPSSNAFHQKVETHFNLQNNEFDDDPVVPVFKPKQMNQTLLAQANPPVQMQSSIISRMYDAFFGP